VDRVVSGAEGHDQARDGDERQHPGSTDRVAQIAREEQLAHEDEQEAVGRRIAFSAWNGRQTRIYAVTVADCTVERLGPRANVNAGTADWSSTNLLAFDGTAPGGAEEGIYTMAADGGHVRGSAGSGAPRRARRR
jgi:hypothetical protein